MKKSKEYLDKLMCFNLLLMLALFPSSAGAQGDKLWHLDGQAVSQASEDQENVRQTTDGEGGAIVVWHDDRNGNLDIFAQRLDYDGNPLWTLDGIEIAVGAESQKFPEITSDGTGGAIITWKESSQVLAQRINAEGVAQWTESGVSLTTTGANTISITTDMAGGAFIVFNTHPGPRVVHIDHNGSLTGPGLDGINLGEGVLAAGGPVISSDGNGGAIVAWANGTENILTQRVTPSLTRPWGVTPTPISTDSRREARPDIASDGSGGAIITWVRQPDGDTPPTAQVVVQRIDEDGKFLWTSDGVVLVDSGAVGGNLDAWSIYEVTPVICTNGSGGAFVVWNDWRNQPDPGGNDDIFGQLVDASGVPQWTAYGLSLHPYPGGSQRRPKIVSDGDGGAVVTIQDMGHESWDISAIGLDVSGTNWFSDVYYGDVPSETDQTEPVILFDGTGPAPVGAIIAWVDGREDSSYWGNDIYAQKLSLGVDIVDIDDDGIPDDDDNCPEIPNGPELGTCIDDMGNTTATCDIDNTCIAQCDTEHNLCKTLCGGNKACIGTCNSEHIDCISDCSGCKAGFMCSMNQEDDDGDEIGDVCDNCPETPNGPELGTCIDDMGNTTATCNIDNTCVAQCDAAHNLCKTLCGGNKACIGTCNSEHIDCISDCSGCKTGFMCSMNQEDGDGDDIGDVCDNLSSGDDIDNDGISDDDNCPETPNGPDGGTCIYGKIGEPCTSMGACSDGPPFIIDSCSMNQEDDDGDGIGDACDNCPTVTNEYQTNSDNDAWGNICDNCPTVTNEDQADSYPPGGNNCGDACECEGNFDGDKACDGSDAFIFKEDFGRNTYQTPCTGDNPCNGDFDCDEDVDGADAFTFKEDFGRSQYQNPCPNCKTVPWCDYPPQTRFTDNEDGTVTDNNSGLVWLKDAHCPLLHNEEGGLNWSTAVFVAFALSSNYNNCGLDDGSSIGDWRLPTSNEFQDFMCTEYFNPAVCNTGGTDQWSEGDPFNNVLDFYWSSTEYELEPDNANVGSIKLGGVFYDLKTSSYYVWPVRNP